MFYFRLELTLVGGFKDDRQMSEELSVKIFGKDTFMHVFISNVTSILVTILVYSVLTDQLINCK